MNGHRKKIGSDDDFINVVFDLTCCSFQNNMHVYINNNNTKCASQIDKNSLFLEEYKECLVATFW